MFLFYSSFVFPAVFCFNGFACAMNGYSLVSYPIARNVLGGKAFVIENIVSSSIFVADSKVIIKVLEPKRKY